MRSKSKGILIGGISATLLLGTVGAIAYFTNGFKDITKIRELAKSGKVVEKLVLTDDQNYFVVKDKNSDLEGSRLLSVNEVIENPITSFDSFADYVEDFELSNKELNKMWEKVAIRDKAYHQHAIVNMQVEKEEQSDTHFVEIPYFDTIRVNYTVDTDCLAMSEAFNHISEKKVSASWNYTSNGSGLYQEVSIFSGKVTADSVQFTLLSLDAIRDFEFEISSIELVNKNSAKASDTLFMYDYANHI